MRRNWDVGGREASRSLYYHVNTFKPAYGSWKLGFVAPPGDLSAERKRERERESSGDGREGETVFARSQIWVSLVLRRASLAT